MLTKTLMAVIYAVWFILFVLFVPLALAFLIFGFFTHTGIEMVAILKKIAGKDNDVHILKTTIEQFPGIVEDVQHIGLEFVASEEDYYKFRNAANKAGLWFKRPLWWALKANKFLYNVLVVNKWEPK